MIQILGFTRWPPYMDDVRQGWSLERERPSVRSILALQAYPDLVEAFATDSGILFPSGRFSLRTPKNPLHLSLFDTRWN